MIVTLTGEDSFGLRVCLRELVSAFEVAHGDMAIERLSGSDASYERIQESLTALPFLSGRKMVVLREGSANKQFAEHVETLLAAIPDTTDVVLVEPKLDKRGAYYKLLKKTTDFREFAKMDEPGLVQWLVTTAKEQGGSLTAPDAHFLVERTGADKQLLASELDKLLLYDAQVNRQTIELLTEPSPQSSIFELLEAAFAGHAKRALELYREQRAQKVDTGRIIAMLTWQLWVVALIQAARDTQPDGVARGAKLSPYTVRKSAAIARELSPNRLRQLVRELATLAARAKRERIDLDEALQHFLLTLAE